MTSPGYEGAFAADPKLIAATLVAGNPELSWCDTSRRGYMAMTVAADRVTNDWIMVDTIKARSTRASVAHSGRASRPAPAGVM